MKRKDIRKILVIGSGPIVIGQAAEFDYSGTQALKALKGEGYEVILINSNPATIMTDPEFSDRTYIEPLTAEFVEKVIRKERPDALLPTLGGQTALNLAVELYESGVLQKYGVELIGAKYEAIKKAEDRELFKKAVEKRGLLVPPSQYAKGFSDAVKKVKEIGLPCVIRPSFTLGGTGGSIVFTESEIEEKVLFAINQSPTQSCLIEKYLDGWKEFELEVMRDKNNNFVVICSIENLDPMGIHTGDSITVAPQQTLTDREYQAMRDAARIVMEEIGVETGGSNIQFAVNPEDGTMMVIEMNPRVSRSSALASKATGFPIAKIAALLAVGYTLDEIPNFITRKTPSSFEPSIDYVVIKIPRFDFEKFEGADISLGTQMKSIGEVMAIGRNFREALLKAIASLEKEPSFPKRLNQSDKEIIYSLKMRHPMRIFGIFELLRRGYSIDEIHKYTKIDRWFLNHMKKICEIEEEIRKSKDIRKAKENGFSDKYISYILGMKEEEVRRIRRENGIIPVVKSVDTCGGEFPAETPYFYMTYDYEDEASFIRKKKGVVIGAGPNRIGQGIEFDYSCVHAIKSLREMDYYAIMINSNPETVSTDYDTSDRLYFEPITLENVLEILWKEKPDLVFVSFGGQTPLKIAKDIEREGFKIAGTSPESVDIAEDREKFRDFLENLGIKQPLSKVARSKEDAIKIAREIGYPVLLRPSYVLGGRAMAIVYSDDEVKEYMEEALKAYEGPVLVDKYLEGAKEIDVDLVSDGKDVLFGGILEHIEPAGIHSGDSATILPPYSLSKTQKADILDVCYNIARYLNIVGPLNVQIAIYDGEVYVLEANPRASRTMPFVSKATGIPLIKIATYVMCGKKLKDFKRGYEEPPYFAVKEVVLPFSKIHGFPPYLGPEMRSTGEVMGIDFSLKKAFLKSQIATQIKIPQKGTVLFTLRDRDKEKGAEIAREFLKLGFKILATDGTYKFFTKKGIRCEKVFKLHEGSPNISDLIKQGKIDIVVNTTDFTKKSIYDAAYIRRTAIAFQIPYYTTVEEAEFLAMSLKTDRNFEPFSLQEIYKTISNKNKKNLKNKGEKI